MYDYRMKTAPVAVDDGIRLWSNRNFDMKIGKILAISVAFGLASASVASATVVGVDMFGGGKGKKGSFSLSSIGDGEMVGARMGFNNKKFKR